MLFRLAPLFLPFTLAVAGEGHHASLPQESAFDMPSDIARLILDHIPDSRTKRNFELGLGIEDGTFPTDRTNTLVEALIEQTAPSLRSSIRDQLRNLDPQTFELTPRSPFLSLQGIFNPCTRKHIIFERLSYMYQQLAGSLQTLDWSHVKHLTVSNNHFGRRAAFVALTGDAAMLPVPWRQLSALESLDIDFMQNEETHFLTHLPKLKSFVVRRSRFFTSAALSAIVENVCKLRVRRLELHVSHDLSSAAEACSQNANLQQLLVKRNEEFLFNFLFMLVQGNKLERLEIQEIERIQLSTHHKFKRFQTFPNLKHFIIKESSANLHELIAYMPGLTHLSLCAGAIGFPSSAELVSTLRHLEKLELTAGSFRSVDSFMDRLSEDSTFSDLVIDEIIDSDYVSISKFSKIRHLRKLTLGWLPSERVAWNTIMPHLVEITFRPAFLEVELFKMHFEDIVNRSRGVTRIVLAGASADGFFPQFPMFKPGVNEFEGSGVWDRPLALMST